MQITLVSFSLVLFICITAYLAYYFGRKAERWDFNYNTVAEGVWIEVEQSIDCSSSHISGNQTIPAGTLARVTNVSNFKKFNLRLANPIEIAGNEITEVLGIKDYSKFRIIPEALIEKEMVEKINKEVDESLNEKL